MIGLEEVKYKLIKIMLQNERFAAFTVEGIKRVVDDLAFFIFKNCRIPESLN